MSVRQLIRQHAVHLLSPFSAGTDHQRIAKLDRENEVAPPPKVAPSVGRVWIFPLF